MIYLTALLWLICGVAAAMCVRAETPHFPPGPSGDADDPMTPGWLLVCVIALGPCVIVVAISCAIADHPKVAAMVDRLLGR